MSSSWFSGGARYVHVTPRRPGETNAELLARHFEEVEAESGPDGGHPMDPGTSL